MRGKDAEDGTKDIQCDSDCLLCLHAQCVCPTNNIYEAVATLDSIWERKSCKKKKQKKTNCHGSTA